MATRSAINHSGVTKANDRFSDEYKAHSNRAATLKLLKHIYRVHKFGGQTVWVYSPPKADSGWVFDEIAGESGTMTARRFGAARAAAFR